MPSLVRQGSVVPGRSEPWSRLAHSMSLSCTAATPVVGIAGHGSGTALQSGEGPALPHAEVVARFCVRPEKEQASARQLVFENQGSNFARSKTSLEQSWSIRRREGQPSKKDGGTQSNKARARARRRKEGKKGREGRARKRRKREEGGERGKRRKSKRVGRHFFSHVEDRRDPASQPVQLKDDDGRKAAGASLEGRSSLEPVFMSGTRAAGISHLWGVNSLRWRRGLTSADNVVFRQGWDVVFLTYNFIKLKGAKSAELPIHGQWVIGTLNVQDSLG
jgi:hypothetical protein